MQTIVGLATGPESLIIEEADHRQDLEGGMVALGGSGGSLQKPRATSETFT